MSELTDAISALTKKVTKEWTKQRKAEERGKSRASRAYIYSDRTCITHVCGRILPPAYEFVSGGKYTVSKRQVYYGCRDQFREATDEELEYEYFANTLLVQYMNRNPTKTAHWKVTADPRGILILPNAAHEIRVPVGTLAIDGHLQRAGQLVLPFEDLAVGVDVQWPSLAAGQRYQAVLSIEKEGFGRLLEEARIAERFDIAIMSCKGQSVVAARRFVDEVCALGRGVPLLTAHDFDKPGFEIGQRLTSVSTWAEENDLVKYQFQNEIDVHDLGLRLEDVRHYKLEHLAEKCRFKGRFAKDSKTTPQERAFLQSGRRVEMNAMTAPQFVDWMVSSLSKKLPNRLIPQDEVLVQAYRRALAAAQINEAIEDTARQAIKDAHEARIPDSLRDELEAAMKESGEPWDRALYGLAQKQQEDRDRDFWRNEV